MLFIKSFFRKKSSKIFIFIFTLIIFSLIYINSNINKYTSLINDNYSDSFIFVKSNDIIDFDNSYIKESYVSVNCGMYYFIVDDKLKNYETIIPSYMKNDSEFKLNLNDSDVSLEIINYYDSKMSPIIYVSSEILNNIKNNVNSGYYIKINEWTDSEEIIDLLRKKYNKEVYGYEINNSNINFESIIKSNFFFLKVIFVIFILLIIYIIYFIWNELKRKMFLYNSFGIRKITLLNIFIINIILTLLFSIVLSILLYMLYTRLF